MNIFQAHYMFFNPIKIDKQRIVQVVSDMMLYIQYWRHLDFEGDG